MAIGVTQKWYAGAAGASVLVLAAGYLLLVSPQQTNASQISAQADTVAAANQHSEVQIDALKAQFANLPLLQSQVAAIHARLPQAPEEPALMRSLSALAKSSGVTLGSVQVAAPVPMTPATGTSQAAGLSADGQVSQLALTLDISGTFASTRLFLNGLESLQRSMLVTGIDVSAGAATAGNATSIQTVVAAKVFMANPGSAPVVTATGTGTGSTTTQPS